MSHSGLIVCERTGDWALALRRALAAIPDAPVRLYETRSPEECRAALADFSAAVVAIELTAANVGAVTELLTTLDRRSPRFVTVVLLATTVEIDDAPLRECGAAHVARSVVEAPALAEIARRHLARQDDADGSPRLSLREQIWRRLPWGE